MSSNDPPVNYFSDVDPDVFAQFSVFCLMNPEIYERLREMALALVASGRQHYGMKSLWEALRYHATLTSNDQTFELNNIYTSLYARLLMTAEPSLQGFFEVRRCRRTLRQVEQQ